MVNYCKLNKEKLIELISNSYDCKIRTASIKKHIGYKDEPNFSEVTLELNLLSEDEDCKDKIYTGIREKKTLSHGVRDGFRWYVCTLGTHPCCYVDIEHILDDINKLTNNNPQNFINIIPCHGGINYTSLHLIPNTCENKKLDGFFIGWDYAHAGDYHTDVSEILNMVKNSHKYTVSELELEILEVINYLKLLIL